MFCREKESFAVTLVGHRIQVIKKTVSSLAYAVVFCGSLHTQSHLEGCYFGFILICFELKS